MGTHFLPQLSIYHRPGKEETVVLSPLQFLELLGLKEPQKVQNHSTQGSEGPSESSQSVFFKLCSIEFQSSAKGSQMWPKGLRAKDRTGSFAVFIPLLYGGLVHTNSLEKGLPLTKSLKTTYVVQIFLEWLTILPSLVCSMSLGLCCPHLSLRQTPWLGDEAPLKPLAFCLHGVCTVCHPAAPDCFSCPSFNFILGVSFLFGIENIY